MSIRKSFPSSSFPYNKKHCGVEGAEKALSYTHVHKIINVSVLYMEYRLTDFDVDQSFTLPCSVSYLSIHTAVTKPLFPYIKECKDGGGGGERKIFFLLMYIKLPMHLFCTSNIKSLKWPNPLHFSVSYFPPIQLTQKQCRMGGGRWG